VSDQLHANEHRPALFELRDDVFDDAYDAASRWPVPFDDDDLDQPDDQAWWLN